MKTEESLRQGMKESLEAEGKTLPAGACSAFLYRAWMVLCLYQDQTGLCLYREQMVPYLSPDHPDHPGSPLLDPCLFPGQMGLCPYPGQGNPAYKGGP